MQANDKCLKYLIKNTRVTVCSTDGSVLLGRRTISDAVASRKTFSIFFLSDYVFVTRKTLAKDCEKFRGGSGRGLIPEKSKINNL